VGEGGGGGGGEFVGVVLLINLALVGAEWSISRSGRYTPGESSLLQETTNSCDFTSGSLSKTPPSLSTTPTFNVV